MKIWRKRAKAKNTCFWLGFWVIYWLVVTGGGMQKYCRQTNSNMRAILCIVAIMSPIWIYFHFCNISSHQISFRLAQKHIFIKVVYFKLVEVLWIYSTAVGGEKVFWNHDYKLPWQQVTDNASAICAFCIACTLKGGYKKKPFKEFDWL